jgi:cytochrome c-type biogenesis protein CcmH/NrfG
MLSRLFFTTAFLAAAVLAQNPPGTGNPGTGGGGGGNTGNAPIGNTPTPGRGTTTTPLPGNRDPLGIPEPPRPVFLSGRVMMEDGTPPPEPVTIERVCNGQPIPEGYTDSKGRFSFELGRRFGVVPDASINQQDDPIFGNAGGAPGMRSSGSAPGVLNSGRMGSRGGGPNLMGCELRASLPGYQSTIVNLSLRNPLDNPEVGTILLKRIGNREGNMFSVTTALAPKDARKSWEKARDLLKKNKVDDAEKELVKATELYPKFAAGWFDLGKVYEQKNATDRAKASYQKAIEADAKYVYPYNNLALIAMKEQNWPEVVTVTDRILKLDPYDFPAAWYFNAVANFNLQNWDAAEKSAKEIYNKDPKRYARAGYVWGLILAQKSDYSAAAERLKTFIDTAPRDIDLEVVKKQLAEIEKFASNRQ